MALNTQEVSFVDNGIQANAPSEGAFALNMLFKNNCWQVRKGFGQVTQFDATMSLPVGGSSTSVWGYKKHLGSHLIKTDFGNEQILSVFLSTVNSSAVSDTLSAGATWSESTSKTVSQDVDIYLVSIYDITTGERFELPLYLHTSQKVNADSFVESTPSGSTVSGGRALTNTTGLTEAAGTAMPQYQTSATNDYQAWVRAEDEFFYFEEFGDILYFGNRATGTWAYLPASFNGLRRSYVDKINHHEWSRPYGETCIIVPLVLVPGADRAGFEYLASTDLPSPSDISSLLDRVCYASGKQVFFSDQNKPSSIKVLNVIDVPCESDITAITEQNGNLLIFTSHECYLYQPSLSDLLSGGKLTKISDHVGCVAPSAVESVDNRVVFVDTSGIYTVAQGTSVSKLSEDITPFFTDSMPNPLTSAFLTLGSPGDASQYYETSLRANLSGVKCSYSSSLEALIVCFPGMNGAMCSTSGRWSWWSFDSISTSDGEPGVTQNLPSPWIVCSQSDLFMLAGPDVQSLTDGARDPATSAVLGGNTASRSFIICRYGRGGAIDRSIGGREDHRLITGRWRIKNALVNSPANGGFYFEEPVKIEEGFNFIAHGESATSTRGQAGARDYFVPISVVITSTDGPWASRRASNHAIDGFTGTFVNYVLLVFAFDTANWEPVIESGGTTDIVWDLSSERLPTNANHSIADWSVSVSNNVGTPTVDGGHIAIAYDGRTGLSGNVYDGSLNIPINRRAPLIRIAMRRKSSTSSVSGMGISPQANYSLVGNQPSGGTTSSSLLPSYIFDQWVLSRTEVRDFDDMAQPVDWAYRSSTVGLGEGKELKFRGIYADVLSHGAGTNKIQSSWQYGLMNTIASSDRRDLAAQVLDITDNPATGSTNNRTRVNQQSGYTGTPPAASSAFSAKDTIRKTVRSELSGNPTVEKVFSSDGSVVYSDLGAGTTTGNVLIGDEDVNQVAISMGVKGQSFNVMMFGFIRNRAERLFIEGAKAAFRVLSGRRRKGR